MYKEAIRSGMRIQTNKGNLSIEQLWDLPLTELNTLAVSLDEKYKNSKGKSFLDTKTVADKGLKNQFDIVLDILETKKEELDIASKKKENKDHNAKIFALIAKKKEGELEGKSLKQLEAMLLEE